MRARLSSELVGIYALIGWVWEGKRRGRGGEEEGKRRVRGGEEEGKRRGRGGEVME